MKLDSQSNKVVLLHLGCLLLGGLLGALLGNPNHIVLGTSLGSFLGTLVPGLFASLRGKSQQPNSIGHLCGAVFSNDWITAGVNRSAIEEIRGQVYITWFGVLVGALIAGYALHAALPFALITAALGGALTWLANRFLS